MGRRDIGVVDPKDLRIPVWVSVGSNFGGPKHNEGMGVRIDSIVIAPDVIGRIVHGELLCQQLQPNIDNYCVNKLTNVYKYTLLRKSL